MSLPTYAEATNQAGIKNGMNILLVSKTGGGKSTLGNALLHLSEADYDAFKVSNAMYSSTVECECSSRTIAGRQYTVVDTPGTMDTMNPQRALRELVRAIVLCPSGFHTILLVIRCDCRFTEEEKMAVELLVRMFGPGFYRFCIIVFSHGGCLENDRNKLLENLQKARRQNSFLNTLLISCDERLVLIENGPHRQQNVQEVQLTTLRTMMENLVRQNSGEKFSNEYFELAREALAEERQLLDDIQRARHQKFERQVREAGEAERAHLRAQLDAEIQGFSAALLNRVTDRIKDRAEQNGGSCFPADATVHTPEGPVHMSELRLGQLVLGQEPDGRLAYSPVYTWGHRDPHACPSAWTVVRTASGASLTLSSDHLLPVATDKSRSIAPALVAARRLRAGASAVWTLEDGGRHVRRDLVTEIRTFSGGERTPARGLFAPFTLSGNLVVDGVLASCYVDCGIPAPLMHALLWPVRSAWRVWPSAVEATGCPDADSVDGMPDWVCVAVKYLLPGLQRLLPAVEGEVDDSRLF